MEFYDVVRTRRSVRSYSDKPVPDDALDRVLEAARLAPSANNVQPWHYVVVRGKDKIQEIARLSHRQMFVAQAPVVIVLCGKKYTDPAHWAADNMYLVDTTISMDHLILAARAEGLGTCWIGAFNRPGIEKLFALPRGIHAMMLTPLGYPSGAGAFTDRTWRKSAGEIRSDEEYRA
ncbi:MAG: nitroreductase [Chitinivibrionales bacterium]|nr:nitroreductase [Chitinivibrionales bacterium]MBD3394080.1 nitroreductase [Chitinivibrionales bacterium]